MERATCVVSSLVQFSFIKLTLHDQLFPFPIYLPVIPPAVLNVCFFNPADFPLVFLYIGKEDGKSCQKVTVRMTIRKNDCRSNRPVGT